MLSLTRVLSSFLVLLASLPAAATFHLWQMNELYSSADGKVQFLELTALAPGQQFIAGHTLAVTQGGVTHEFEFTGSLPGESSGRKFVVGTQTFATLMGLSGFRPDFTVPDNFFFLGNGTIDFGEAADIWNYSGLPSDGNLSLNRDGSTAVNSPTNFARSTGRVILGTPNLNFQALWWKAPEGSESGWGVNITHQGDILFATWFTYDADGSGMWLVMSNGARIGSNTYSGSIFRTTGPAFNSVPFDPTRVDAVNVGSATFTFADANNGTFAYTLNGVSQTKAITRQVYAAPSSNCAAGGAASATPNYQDLWWRAPAGSESGWGVNITHQAETLFATWFTYGADGKGIWLVMSNGAKTGTSTYSGALFRTTGPPFNSVPFEPSRVDAVNVGSATFTFSDSNNGTFAYTFNGVSQTKAITRQVYSSPATVCRQ